MRETLREVRDSLRLSPGARVLDVGGAKDPFQYERVTILDLQSPKGKERWIEWDACNAPWPFEDRVFDFVVCSHLLEDVRDPIAVCKEMMRVGRAGYIETPSWQQELGYGHDLYKFRGHLIGDTIPGYAHHRWIVLPREDGLAFVFKYPYYIWRGEFQQGFSDSNEVRFWWQGQFEAEERFIPYPKDAEAFYAELGILKDFHAHDWPCARGGAKEVSRLETHPCYYCGEDIALKDFEDCPNCGLVRCPHCGKCFCNSTKQEKDAFKDLHFNYCCVADRLRNFAGLPQELREVLPGAEKALYVCKKLFAGQSQE